MATYTVKLRVITDTNGKVLGTQQLVDPLAIAQTPVYSRLVPEQDTIPSQLQQMPVYSRITAGPGQQEHEIEVELPEQLFRDRNVTELHSIVQAEINRRQST
jgi:hypothetical protein